MDAASSVGPPVPAAGRKWGWMKYSLGLVGSMIVALLLYVTFDYGQLDKILNLWASLEQPNYFRPSPNETLFVNLTLVERAVEKGAVCLDGSPPAYHLHRGTGSGKNSWLVHLEGGGWCSNKKTCASRATTQLGSSHYMESFIPFDGVFSNSPSKNPDFYNWNRVKVRYCDGGSFSGEIEMPIEVDQVSHQVKKIYFRGQRIWQAVIENLLSKGMDKAEKALLSGCSAGGLASILHCDDFRSRFPTSNANVKCLSDAGFFLDVQNVNAEHSMRSFYNKVVAQHGIALNLPERCKAERDARLCFFPQYVLKDIRTPLFILQPGYDTWQIGNVLVPIEADPSSKWSLCKANPASCTKEQLKTLQGFREKLLQAIDAVEGSEEGGLYINSCFVHCQIESDLTWHKYRTPTVNRKTIADAVGDWFFKRGTVKYIDCAYPCNPTCFHVGVWGSS